jgi:hypothetical protein
MAASGIRGGGVLNGRVGRKAEWALMADCVEKLAVALGRRLSL